MKRLSTVVLDVNETLFSLASLKPAFESVGLDAGLVPLWFARLLRDGFALTSAGDFRPFGEIGQAVLHELIPEPLPSHAAATVMEAFHELQPHPDVPEGLKLLAAAGLRLVTLTVGDLSLVHTLFRRAGLEGYLTTCLSADTVRRWKPAPEPYHYAMRELNTTPQETALVAAHDWDIHGAARVGMITARIDRIPASPVFTPADVIGNDLPSVARQLIALSEKCGPKE